MVVKQYYKDEKELTLIKINKLYYIQGVEELNNVYFIKLENALEVYNTIVEEELINGH